MGLVSPVPDLSAWGRQGEGNERQIMQTWKDINGNHADNWLAQNPGWRYNFLTDTDAMAFLRAVDPTQGYACDFGVLALGAMKADFLRLVWLETYGGFYIDQDLTPSDLEQWTNQADIIVVKGAYDPEDCISEVYNAFMFVRRPHSKFIARALELAR